jgi:isoleucyl-tRNA synthetase
MFVKQADPLIEADLRERGLLYHVGRYAHTYPFCWRCHTPLLYYAKATWLVRTTAIRDPLVATNQEINWYPEHIKDGRFGNWLANAYTTLYECLTTLTRLLAPFTPFVAEEMHQILVAISTAVSEALRREGLAREVVRRIQVMRKDAGLRIEEPIQTCFEATGELRQVVEEWVDYVARETLSHRLVAAMPPSGAYVERQRVDGQELTLGIVQVEEVAPGHG